MIESDKDINKNELEVYDIEKNLIFYKVIFALKQALNPKTIFLSLKTKSIKFAKESAHNSVENFKSFFKFTKKLGWKAKLILIFLILSTFVVGYVIYFMFRIGLPIKEKDIFLNSLQEVATEVATYDLKEGQEFFFDSIRASQNIMYLPKQVVNLKPSPGSGRNPMAAFEVYLEGNSPEVLIEIKDREAEVKDVIQRTAEKEIFESLETIEGKKLFLEKLQREVNSVLTMGRLRKVYFKTFISKP
jgi:flagellar basal body-associated protein FliL